MINSEETTAPLPPTLKPKTKLCRIKGAKNERIRKQDGSILSYNQLESTGKIQLVP